MEFRKIIPALAVSLGLAAAAAANAAEPQQYTGVTPAPATNGSLFQMDEVNTNGAPVAAGGDDHKCGGGSCGAAKPEKPEGDAEHKCGAGACGSEADVNDDGDDAKCGAGSCGAEDKGDDAKCGSKEEEKGDDHKCGGTACGAAH